MNDATRQERNSSPAMNSARERVRKALGMLVDVRSELEAARAELLAAQGEVVGACANGDAYSCERWTAEIMDCTLLDGEAEARLTRLEQELTEFETHDWCGELWAFIENDWQDHVHFAERKSAA